MSSDTPETDTNKKPKPGTVDPMLLSALVCPKSRTPLIHDRDENILISKKAKLAYPIREGVPIMLVDEAVPYEP